MLFYLFSKRISGYDPVENKGLIMSSGSQLYKMQILSLGQ